MIFKCKVCEALKIENEYLKKLVDNLLIRNGVQAVSVAPEETIPASPIPDGIRFGEG